MKLICVLGIWCLVFINTAISQQQSTIRTQNSFSEDSLVYPDKNEMVYPFSNTYKSSWSELKNGKEQNMNKYADIKWNSQPIIIDNYIDETQFKTINEEGNGESSYIKITGNNTNSDIEININGKHITKHFNNRKLEWNKDDKNYKGYFNNNVIWLRKFNKVIIENINLVLWDPNLSLDGSHTDDLELTASASIRTDDCKEVIIRDCYLGGEASRHHIQIQNSDRVFIDRVEIAGIRVHKVYKDNKDSIVHISYLCGGGIKISKSDYQDEKQSLHDIWNVVQNCYIHDNNIALASKNNWDGITTSVPGNSLIFNCYIENWGVYNEQLAISNEQLKIGADCALDLSEPGVPIAYKDYVFRIEHNIFKNCKGVKNSYSYTYKSTVNSRQSTVDSQDYEYVSHLFTDNIYYNTPLWDYHTGYKVYHVRETLIFDNKSNKKYVYKFEGSDLSPVSFQNNIVYINTTVSSFKIFNVRNFNTDVGSKKNFAAFKAENNLYLFRNNPATWVNFVNNKKDNVKTIDQWMKYESFNNNQVKGSLLIMIEQNKAVFKCFTFGKCETFSDFRLLPEFEKEYLNLKSFINISNKKGMVLSKD